jgi:hypothetical protein
MRLADGGLVVARLEGVGMVIAHASSRRRSAVAQPVA